MYFMQYSIYSQMILGTYIISGCQKSVYFFFKFKFIFDKKSIYSEKILGILYQIVKVSVFKKNNVLGSNEYFVVYIDIINLKLKQEIIIQQLLTITLLLINAIISIKAL